MAERNDESKNDAPDTERSGKSGKGAGTRTGGVSGGKHTGARNAPRNRTPTAKAAATGSEQNYFAHCRMAYKNAAERLLESAL